MAFQYRLTQLALLVVALAISTLPQPFQTVYLIGFLLELQICHVGSFGYILRQETPPLVASVVQAEMWPVMLVFRAVRSTWLIIKRRRATRPS